MNKTEVDYFKLQLIDYFNQRTNYDNESDFHPRLAESLIKYANIQKGQNILDIATGTGLVAIAAAQLVGAEGKVIGIDISPGMLNQAKRKIETLNITNIEFQKVDAENLDFPENSFDIILCCSALPFFRDIPKVLSQGYKLLKPGKINHFGFSGFSETSFIGGLILTEVAKNHGIFIPKWNEQTGTSEKCYNLLQTAGFENIEIYTEQFGSYMTLKQAEKVWDNSLKNPLCLPLLQLYGQRMAAAKAEYMAKIQLLLTEKGIWNDITTFFVFGRKSS